jgi:hypothetical protein
LEATVKTFIEGPAGTGKTTQALATMSANLEAGEPVLVLVPQYALGQPYYEAWTEQVKAGHLTVRTYVGLAQRMVDLFWPMIAEDAGFAQAGYAPPTLLSMEMAQYFMGRLVAPMIDQGSFETVALRDSRLYGQLLDALNKSALVGFPVDEIGSRLTEAWVGDQSRRQVYREVQTCVNRFRKFCLEHNLVDVSLVVEVFREHLWPQEMVREYLYLRYPHLVIDNVEEMTPAAHDMLADWLPEARSAFVVYDSDGGARRFLGADPASARTLKHYCEDRRQADISYNGTAGTLLLGERMAYVLEQRPTPVIADGGSDDGVLDAVDFVIERFYPAMVDTVVDRVASLVHEQGVAPGEIAVLSAFLSDAQRFLVSHGLQERGVPVHSHRPAHPLRDDPQARCLLTLARLAHPEWEQAPRPASVAHALTLAIDGLDMVRAYLLVDAAYNPDGDAETPTLMGTSTLEVALLERVTFTLAETYNALATWINETPADEHLDHYIARLFQFLAQPGFGFRDNADSARVAESLIEAIQKFRSVLYAGAVQTDVGREYVSMLNADIVAAQYVRAWERPREEEAVLLAPAYTFLVNDQRARYQFWLDAGNPAWWERLAQPVTHPYVLSRQWERGTVWDDSDEVVARNRLLATLVLGLTRRCGEHVTLALSVHNEHGQEQRGLLAQVAQQVLREEQR